VSPFEPFLKSPYLTHLVGLWQALFGGTSDLEIPCMSSVDSQASALREAAAYEAKETAEAEARRATLEVRFAG
jgi:hypothetical protein